MSSSQKTIFRNEVRGVLMKSQNIHDDLNKLLSWMIKGVPKEAKEIRESEIWIILEGSKDLPKESRMWIILREFEKISPKKTNPINLDKFIRLAEPKKHTGSGSSKKQGDEAWLMWVAYNQAIKLAEQKLVWWQSRPQKDLLFDIIPTS